MPFSLDADWCAYLYMNGVISTEIQTDSQNQPRILCRFSCPFIQNRLYNALTLDLIGDRLPMPALEFLDDLADVFEAGLIYTIGRSGRLGYSRRFSRMIMGRW